MGNPTKKPLIAVIGGIASGKSTVAAQLAKLGCAVIDADKMAHDLLEENSVRDELVRLFGPEILSASGTIDRAKLARIVFADAAQLQRLNDVVHPRVLERTEELIEHYQSNPGLKAIVLDMPLLVEVGWAGRCNRIVFVDCDRTRRVHRAKCKGQVSEREIKIRENFQISLDRKKRLADNTIDNNSDFSTLVRQIKKIFSDITKNS
ncbi:MAG: dephospho-CoA kinase [Sedimentisphaerales bacterium]|nr:dephospho-CoA kinase [Sedimentisphaerales bacterium]